MDGIEFGIGIGFLTLFISHSFVPAIELMKKMANMKALQACHTAITKNGSAQHKNEIGKIFDSENDKVEKISEKVLSLVGGVMAGAWTEAKTGEKVSERAWRKTSILAMNQIRRNGCRHNNRGYTHTIPKLTLFSRSFVVCQ